MKFKVECILNEEKVVYDVVNVNAHMVGGANPVIEFTLWDPIRKCWMIDDAGKYRPLEEGF